MKHVGTKNEYAESRNRDLIRVFHEQYEAQEFKNIWELLERTVNSPSERFWVSEYRAAYVVKSIMLGDDLKKMTKMKREMFMEIYRRTMNLRRKRPDATILELVNIVVNQPAPKFYLTPGSANVIIHKTKKKWKEERMRKLRHLSL